jgi:hypothetical protein
VIAGGNSWLKKTNARCVLISDSSQACNGTIVSAAAEYLYSGASDTVIECETGGSIRLALIAVLGFIIIPIPFLLCCVDGEAGHLEAIAFALKHGIASSSVVPIDSDCRHHDLGSGGSNMSDDGGAKQYAPAVFEMSIHVPDSSAALAGTLPKVQ